MLFPSPLFISQQLLASLGTRTFVHHANRIPHDNRILVVSNHRSFMDAPLLMTAVNQSIRFACHHYMSQVPVLREFVYRFGCLPMDAPGQRYHHFFDQAVQMLRSRQMVGIFPEGAQPMVTLTQSTAVSPFHRGFAHLALRAPLDDLAILPVAIAPQVERVNTTIPLTLFRWFDPSEPLFNQSGQHPVVVYQRVDLLIGRPIWITAAQRQQYQSRHAKAVATELTTYCQSEIEQLLRCPTSLN